MEEALSLLNIEDEEEKEFKLKYHGHQTKNAFDKKLIDTAIFDEHMYDHIMKGIVQNIICEMNKQHLCCNDLAVRSGIAATVMSKILNYKFKIGMKSFIKIAIALQVPASDLIPLDAVENRRKGYLFDELTKGLEIKDVNYLLDLTAKYVALKK